MGRVVIFARFLVFLFVFLGESFFNVKAYVDDMDDLRCCVRRG